MAAPQAFDRDGHKIVLKLSIPGVFQPFCHVELDPHLLSGAESATAKMLQAVKDAIKHSILLPVRRVQFIPHSTGQQQHCSVCTACTVFTYLLPVPSE